jgi:long-chain acyl-CoA synthetase
LIKLNIGLQKTVRKPNYIFTTIYLGKDVNNLAAVINEPVFKKLVLDDMNRVGAENKISGLEKPKDIVLTLEAFSIENNILTPTFKLKRNIARDIYKTQIEAMYEELKKQGL